MDSTIEIIYKLLVAPWNIFVIVMVLVVPILILIFGRRNEALINSIPGFCTSVGIMTTFAVLYGVLSNKEITTTEPRYLIDQLSNKFSASLIGIFFSILYNFIIKIFKPYEFSYEPWKEVDPQRVVYDMYLVQIKQLEIANESLSKQNSINEELTKGISSLNSSISFLSSSISEIKRDFHDNINSLSDSLKTNLEENLTRVGRESHVNLQNSLEDMHSQFSVQAIKNLNAYQEEMGGRLDAVNFIFENLTSNLNEAIIQVRKQNENAMVSSQENSLRIAEGFQGATEQLNRELIDQAKIMREMFTRLSDSFQNLDQRISEAGSNLIQRNIGQMELGILRVQEIEARHLTLLENITRAFGDSVEKYGDVSLLHSDVLKKIAEQSQSMGDLNNSNTQLIVALNSNLEFINRIREEVAALFNTVDYLQSIRKSIHNNNAAT
jgi:hypothetical protein